MTTTDSQTAPGSRELSLAMIDPTHWNNPRGDVDTDSCEFSELVASIKAQGLLEPVVVGPTMLKGGRHPLIAGWRRYTAAKVAGQDTIDVHQRSDITDERAALRAALAENVARQDMAPSCEARALARLMDLGDTQAAAAKAIGVSERTARERLRLLTLPESVRAAIDTKKVPSTATRQLQQIADASPEAADALAAKITKGDLDGAVLLDGRRTQQLLAELVPQGVALLRLSPNVSIRELPLGDDKDAKALRARARKASEFGGDYLSLRPAGRLTAALEAARKAGKILKLPKADQYSAGDVEFVAGPDAVRAVITAAVELAEHRAAERERDRGRHQAQQQAGPEEDLRAAAQAAARERQAVIDAAAAPHAEAMNAEILRRIDAMRSCALTGPVAALVIALTVPPGYRHDDAEFTVTTGYRLLDAEHPIGQLADGHDDAGLQPRLAAMSPDEAAAVIIGGLAGFYFADRRGTDAGHRRGFEPDDPMLPLVTDAATALTLLPDRALKLRDAHAQFLTAVNAHQRDGARRRILHELSDASKKGLQRDALFDRCKQWKHPGQDGLDRYAAANVSFHDDFDQARADLERDQLLTITVTESDGGSIQRHHKITLAGRKHRSSPPAQPPVFADIDPDDQPAAVDLAPAADGPHEAGPVIVKVRHTHDVGSDEAELQPDRQTGRPNVRKVIYTASRTAAWVATKRIINLPDDDQPATAPTPKLRKGVAARRDDALVRVTAQPGITIPELAEAMGIKQNYLYRILPELAKAAKLHKQGRGWHPGDGKSA